MNGSDVDFPLRLWNLLRLYVWQSSQTSPMRCDHLTKVSTQKRGAGARTFLLFFYVFNPRLIGRMMRHVPFGSKTNFLISSAFYQIPLLTLLLYHIRYNNVNYASYFSKIFLFSPGIFSGQYSTQIFSQILLCSGQKDKGSMFPRSHSLVFWLLIYVSTCSNVLSLTVATK